VRLGGEHPRQDAERRPDRLLREHASGDRLGTGCDGGPWPAVSYDQHGNQLRWDITRFEYDFLDVLRRSYDQVGVDIVRDHSYLYTADDERIATIEIPTTPFGKLIETWRLRDLDDRILREYTYNRSQDRWTWQKDWIHGAGRLLSTHDRDSGELRHASLDHLGNTRLVTGNGGNLIARYDYYAHGDPIEPITNESEVLRFTGHERDSRGMGGAAGYGALNYMHARYQSPYLGRFLTVDPVESGMPSKPQSWHKYAYALNNPLKFTDPDGACAALPSLGTGMVGVCLEAFIPTVFVPNNAGTFPTPGLGDNRSFTLNDPSAGYRISYRATIDPSSGKILDQRADAGLSRVLGFPLKGRLVTGVSTTPLEGGATRYTVSLKGTNGFSSFPGNPGGSIRAQVQFTVTQDGQLADANGTYKGYPAVEFVSYTMVEGELVATFELRGDAGIPAMLHRDEVDEPLKE
jgi:RHS repeat-associated protein